MCNGEPIRMRSGGAGAIALGLALLGAAGCGGLGGGEEVPESESVEETREYIQNPFRAADVETGSDEVLPPQPPK